MSLARLAGGRHPDRFRASRLFALCVTVIVAARQGGRGRASVRPSGHRPPRRLSWPRRGRGVPGPDRTRARPAGRAVARAAAARDVAPRGVRGADLRPGVDRRTAAGARGVSRVDGPLSESRYGRRTFWPRARGSRPRADPSRRAAVFDRNASARRARRDRARGAPGAVARGHCRGVGDPFFSPSVISRCSPSTSNRLDSSAANRPA